MRFPGRLSVRPLTRARPEASATDGRRRPTYSDRDSDPWADKNIIYAGAFSTGLRKARVSLLEQESIWRDDLFAAAKQHATFRDDTRPTCANRALQPIAANVVRCATQYTAIRYF